MFITDHVTSSQSDHAKHVTWRYFKIAYCTFGRAFKLVNAHLLASSWAQVCEGHVVSNETFKTHSSGIICALKHSGDANNGLDRGDINK